MRKCKTKKLLAILGVLVLIAGLSRFLKKDHLVSESDLADHNVYINNPTCDDMFEELLVTDDTLAQEIRSLCAKVKPRYRTSPAEAVAGGRNDVTITFWNVTDRYVFSFSYVNDQLDSGYQYDPVLCAGKDTFLEPGDYAYEKDWGWHCTMTKEDYVALLDLVIDYTDPRFE